MSVAAIHHSVFTAFCVEVSVFRFVLRSVERVNVLWGGHLFVGPSWSLNFAVPASSTDSCFDAAPRFTVREPMLLSNRGSGALIVSSLFSFSGVGPDCQDITKIIRNHYLPLVENKKHGLT